MHTIRLLDTYPRAAYILGWRRRMLAMFGEVPVPSRTPATVKAASGTGVLLLAGLSDLELNDVTEDYTAMQSYVDLRRSMASLDGMACRVDLKLWDASLSKVLSTTDYAAVVLLSAASVCGRGFTDESWATSLRDYVELQGGTVIFAGGDAATVLSCLKAVLGMRSLEWSCALSAKTTVARTAEATACADLLTHCPALWEVDGPLLRVPWHDAMYCTTRRFPNMSTKMDSPLTAVAMTQLGAGQVGYVSDTSLRAEAMQVVAALCRLPAQAKDGPGRTGVKNADSMEGSVLNEVPMDAWIQSCQPGKMAGLMTCAACHHALPKVMFPERELELKATGRARCERCLSRGLKAQVDESEVAADGGIVSGMRKAEQADDLLTADVQMDPLDSYGGY